MKLNVHLSFGFDQDFADSIASNTNDNVILTQGEEIRSPEKVQVLIAGVPKKEELEVCTNISTVIIPWVGLPDATRSLMQDYTHISIHNIHYNTAPVTEMAIGLMLAASKELIPIDKAFRKNDWRPRYQSSSATLLQGKNVLILGYGAIGKVIASVCTSLGMNVNAIKRTVDSDCDGSVKLYSIDSLQQLFKKTNVLFICLPLTPETNDLIGKEELALLPNDATIVNIARGKIVNEKALYDALSEYRIRAGIDVWYEYPDEDSRADYSPSQFPFHKLDNVVMTPHLSGHTNESEKLRVIELAKLLNLAADGKALPNRVDLKLGY